MISDDLLDEFIEMRSKTKSFRVGDRMKEYYEKPYQYRLPMRMPVILRIDGKAFHTLTSKMDKPFDFDLIAFMDRTALHLCENIQGSQIAYIQSDEISILLHNYKRFNSAAWFDNEVQKIVSVAAGMASSCFAKLSSHYFPSYVLPVFDARVFVLPETEVSNYFVWRQEDWERNSLQMLARSLYSHSECHKKNMSEMQEMCFQKGKNWNDLEVSLKRGRCIVRDIDGKWYVHNQIPIFKEDRFYIERYLTVEEG